MKKVAADLKGEGKWQSMNDIWKAILKNDWNGCTLTLQGEVFPPVMKTAATLKSVKPKQLCVFMSDTA